MSNETALTPVLPHEAIIQFIGSITERIEAWYVDAVSAYVALKKIEKDLEKAKEYAYGIACGSFVGMNKLELQNLPFGAKWQERGRTTYEYSQNKDYEIKLAEVKRLEKLIKIATDNNTAVADPETWEMIYPVDFKTSSTFAITV